ncbi:MAG: hypothetical protein FKY71_08315 [Spiribacter salinus]|uniref:Uncharacterized protein n=1 Tax=Spiribacter salinus TaxID=1335746 RepID=A0A540VRW6_9GAMM|nr:MAG: hypothetical protein FKY71_08315 [Spiribacter salinus]
MSREATKKIINGHEWETYPWDGMHGLRMQARLAKVIGPALNKMAGVENLMDADVGGIAAALFERMDERETPQLIRDMLHGTSVDGKDPTMDSVFNAHFAANYGELYQGVAHILQVNFGDLFTMAGAIGVRMGGANQADESSPES